MSVPAGDKIQLTVAGTVATILLDRPQKLNAIDAEMVERLEAIVGEIDRDPAIRVVLVRGAGDRAFSAGADIRAWSALEPLDMWRIWVRRGHEMLDRLAALRQPTIALLHGLVLGGGLELALACDLRIAASDVELGSPEVKLATFPGWGVTRRLADAIGAARAKQLVFTGGRIDADTALAWGLVNEVVRPEELDARGRRLAEEIAVNAPIAVQLAKAAIDGRGIASRSLEAIGGALAATTADGREGAAAFRAKRRPEFTGS